jgi:D-arabinose 1-dehydrogenase-like Zn-dependent alcohol dehydrogenase
MRAPAPFAYHIPKGMDPAEAAPLLCAGITVGGWALRPGRARHGGRPVTIQAVERGASHES